MNPIAREWYTMSFNTPPLSYGITPKNPSERIKPMNPAIKAVGIITLFKKGSFSLIILPINNCFFTWINKQKRAVYNNPFF